MDFDFSDEQQLLRSSARELLRERASLASYRRVLESGAGWDAALWKTSAELGWLGTAVPEAHGGAGYGRLELAVVAEELGRVLAPLPFAASVGFATEALLLAGDAALQARELPRLAAGDLVGTFAIAERPGPLVPERVDTVLEEGRLTGEKPAVVHGALAQRAVVLAQGDAGPCLAWVDLESERVERHPVASVDPTRAPATLVFRGAEAAPLGAPHAGDALLDRLLDRAAVLLAFEQLGGAERAFELTREYTLGRYAFGRPVASFQALKHRLVEVYAAIELARSNCYYGAWALEADSDELPVAACVARLAASAAFELAATEMIQLHGGIGFTWEQDCHPFYRRAKHDAVVLGTPAEWREKLIRRLEQAREKRSPS